MTHMHIEAIKLCTCVVIRAPTHTQTHTHTHTHVHIGIGTVGQPSFKALVGRWGCFLFHHTFFTRGGGLDKCLGGGGA